MITHLRAWLRERNLRRLEYNARCAAAVYAACKARYDAALRNMEKEKDSDVQSSD